MAHLVDPAFASTTNTANAVKVQLLEGAQLRVGALLETVPMSTIRHARGATWDPELALRTSVRLHKWRGADATRAGYIGKKKLAAMVDVDAASLANELQLAAAVAAAATPTSYIAFVQDVIFGGILLCDADIFRGSVASIGT
eukprot:5906316-Prymnesium_polylepis.1